MDRKQITRNGTSLIYPVGWKDLVSALSTARSTGPNVPTWEAFSGNIYAYSFSASTMNELQAEFHVPHDYKPGSKMYFHVHFTPTTTLGGVVRWGFEYTVAKGHKQQAFPTVTTVYVEATVDASTNGVHYITEMSEGQAFNTNLEPDSLILCRVFRDASHANDTYAAKVFGLFLDLHYESDRESTSTKSPVWDT